MADRIQHGTALVQHLALTLPDTVLTCRNCFSLGTGHIWRSMRLVTYMLWMRNHLLTHITASPVLSHRSCRQRVPSWYDPQQIRSGCTLLASSILGLGRTAVRWRKRIAKQHVESDCGCHHAERVDNYRKPTVCLSLPSCLNERLLL